VVVALAAWLVSPPGAVAAGRPAAGERSAPVVYHYSVRGKGNVSSIEEFAAAAAETYADRRGWSLGGLVRFERVASGGDFTLWLAADSRMSTFGGACDVVWSCRNGDNVVINEDRWLGASPAWNAGGESLREYRHMVVNHETGHWLGFGHSTCAAPGVAAAVMQQQSMGLQGCAASAWPLAGERAVVARRLPAPLVTDRARDAIGRDTGNILRA
jgi:uncharacterized protein DUF3152